MLIEGKSWPYAQRGSLADHLRKGSRAPAAVDPRSSWDHQQGPRAGFNSVAALWPIEAILRPY